MAADGKVIIDTQLNNRGFTTGVKNMEGKLGGLNKTLIGLGKTIASVFAVRALVNFGKGCVELGSNIAEVQNVVDVAFGDMAYKIEQFSETAIQNFGMSRLAAKKTASTYMAMARGMGINEAAAADMAIGLTSLTGDVASFFNISQELADVKLKSVFTGETETLKDLGIVMTQTNLQAYALSQGLSKNISDMTQAELVGLRYNFVLNQLSLANGDFARTSSSWANQTRILSMQWQELMSIIGQGLIQVLTPVVRVLNQIVAALINMANTLSAVLSSIFGGANTQFQQTQEAVGGVSSGIEESVENQDALTDATKATNKEQKKTLAGFDEINKLSDSSNAVGGSAGGGVETGIGVPGLVSNTTQVEQTTSRIADSFSELINTIRSYFNLRLLPYLSLTWDKIKTNAQELAPIFQKVWGDIAKLGAPLRDWFSGDFTTYLQAYILTAGKIVSGLIDVFKTVFTDIWNLAIYPIIQTWITKILPVMTQLNTQIISTFGVLFESVKNIFLRIWSEGVAPALGKIVSIWSETWGIIQEAWNNWGTPIFEGIRGAITGTADTLLNLWNKFIKPVIDGLMEEVDWLWANHLKPLWENLADFIGYLMKFITDLYNEGLLPLIDWLVDTFGPTFSLVFKTIYSVVSSVIGAALDILSGIITTLRGIIEFILGVFAGDWERAWNGVVTVFEGIFNGIKGIVKGVVNVIISFINGMISAVVGGVNAVISALNTLHFDVPDWVPLIGGNSWGFNIPTFTAPQIPKLAAGAVIPPNREFLAVLGDQKSGNNIEAPESLLRQIVREELAGSNGGQEITIHFDGTMAQLVRQLKPYLDAENRRRGVQLVKGGAY